MRLEAKRGDIHKAEAETAFIEAVQEALPPDAYKEIRGLPERDIARLAKWAAKWGVNAPSILRVASAWRGGFRIASYQGPPIPKSWRQLVRSLNGRAVDMGGYVPTQTVISEEEERVERRKLETFKVEHPELVHHAVEVEKFWATLPERRAQLNQAQHERDLAPIAADPVTENVADFCERARGHWEARCALGETLGFVASTDTQTKWREFTRHLNWLIRHQIHREHYQHISDSPGAGSLSVSQDAVRKAVGRLARILSLKQRSAPRGRPPSASSK